MSNKRPWWASGARFLGVAIALAVAAAVGGWWAARIPDRPGLAGAAASAAEAVGTPGVVAYMLTGGVHDSPMPDWAIAPFICGVSGLAWAGLAALVSRAARRLRRGGPRAHAA